MLFGLWFDAHIIPGSHFRRAALRAAGAYLQALFPDHFPSIKQT
jgi:hypothetical protein